MLATVANSWTVLTGSERSTRDSYKAKTSDTIPLVRASPRHQASTSDAAPASSREQSSGVGIPRSTLSVCPIVAATAQSRYTG